MAFANLKNKLEESWLDSWALLEFLGSGSFGGVFKAQNKTTKEESAVKVNYLQKHLLDANFDLTATKTLSKMRREFLLLQGKQHDNIVNVHESLEARLNLQQVQNLLKSVVASTNKSAKLWKNNLEFWTTEETFVDFLFIRMELCGMNLRQWIDSCEEKEQTLLIAQIKIIDGILEGLTFLHQNKILHRDLKTENIVIRTDFHKFRVKIGDFGVSRMVHSEASKMSDLTEKPTTTALYKAPELETGTEYTLQADLYSLGLLIFEIIKMLKSNDRSVQFARIKNQSNFVELPKEPYENASDIILQLIQSDIRKRIKTVEDVKLKSSISIILKNKEYSSVEFAGIVNKFAIITGESNGGTVINGNFDLTSDNRVIQNVEFRSELEISGNNNKLSNITINRKYEDIDLWVTGSDNILHDIKIECNQWRAVLYGDRNTISNVTPGKNCNADIYFIVSEGVDHHIRNIANVECRIYIDDPTISCRVENVKWGKGWLEGRNHFLKNVKAKDLLVDGEGHKFINCKGGIKKHPNSKYEFVDCQLKIENRQF